MFILLELLFDVSRHGCINISVFVIPFKCDSTIQSMNSINFFVIVFEGI